MTTYHPETVVCGCCGHAFQHRALGSTNAFGSCDLDMRPPEMARSTLNAQIQHCPSCGYCAVDVSKFTPELRPFIESEAYQGQLKSADCPALASFFVCAGMLREVAGDHEMAGWLFLKAAWVCDDKERDDLARQWRSHAADQFLAAFGRGELFADQAGSSEALVVDCLRRARQFTKAHKLIRTVKQVECEPVIRKILAFQQILIRRSDVACHSVAEALEQLEEG